MVQASASLASPSARWTGAGQGRTEARRDLFRQCGARPAFRWAWLRTQVEYEARAGCVGPKPRSGEERRVMKSRESDVGYVAGAAERTVSGSLAPVVCRAAVRRNRGLWEAGKLGGRRLVFEDGGGGEDVAQGTRAALTRRRLSSKSTTNQAPKGGPSPAPKPAATQPTSLVRAKAGPGAVRIACVDDEEAFQLLVSDTFLSFDKNWKLESFLTARQALKHVPASPPKAVLMDVMLPDLSGIECVRRLRLVMPKVPILMLTGRPDARIVLLSVMAGAAGYVVKPMPPGEIVRALESILRGEKYLCPRAQEALLEALRGRGDASLLYRLSPRELDTLGCVIQGMSDKEIGRALGIETGTAHLHVLAVLKKLLSHSRREVRSKVLGLER
jgi:DNA-binding NarL/FixJ family response regulator